MSVLSNAQSTTAFWKKVEELPKATYDQLPQLIGVNLRRLAFLQDTEYDERWTTKGVHNMRKDEMIAFARLLEVEPIDLLRDYGCGRKTLTLEEAEELAHSQGYTWDLVAHAA